MGGPEALDPAVLARLRALTPPGEPDVLTEILTVFVADVPRRIAALRAAVAAADAAGVQKLAHSLKGSAGNIGAHALFAVSCRLDEAGKTRNLAAAATLVDAVEAEYRHVALEVQKLLG